MRDDPREEQKAKTPSAERSTPRRGGGFGRGRRLGIALIVAGNVVLALLVWALLNFVFTEPTLRRSFDLSPGAQYSLSVETRALLDELRERDLELEIDTFFRRSASGRPDVARIEQRVTQLCYELLGRVRFFGGEHVDVTHHDIERDIRASKEQARATAASPDELSLRIGKKLRRIHLYHDMADIDRPDAGAMPGQQEAQLVLRGFKGEQALASALKSMLLEDVKLRAYWVSDYYAGDPSDAQARGYAGLARLLVEDGYENARLSLQQSREIPADCRLLLLLQPSQPIASREAVMIQSYVRRGGALLMTSALGPTAQNPTFENLLGPLGLGLGRQLVLNGIPEAGPEGRPLFGEPFCQIVQIQDGFHATHPATERLAGAYGERPEIALLHETRPVRLADPLPEGVTGTYLLTTNPFAWTVDPAGGSGLGFAPPSEQALGRRQVAAAIEVTADSEAGAAAPSHGRVVLVGALAFANAFGRGQPLIQRHRKLALELCAWLTQREQRVDVPERYRRTDRIELQPQQVERIGLLVSYLVPIAFLAIAVLLVFWRRRA